MTFVMSGMPHRLPAQDGDLHHQRDVWTSHALKVTHSKDSITLVVSLPQTHSLHFIRKNIRPAQTRTIPQHRQSTLFQCVKGIKDKGWEPVPG